MQNCVFLYSLNNFLLSFFFFFLKPNFKMRSSEKGTIFDVFFTFFSHQGKTEKKFLQHISYLHTYRHLAHPFWPFLPHQNTNLSYMVSLWCNSWRWFLFVPFWSNQWITKWWAKFKLECLLLIFIYINSKFVVICEKRRLQIMVEED